MVQYDKDLDLSTGLVTVGKDADINEFGVKVINKCLLLSANLCKHHVSHGVVINNITSKGANVKVSWGLLPDNRTKHTMHLSITPHNTDFDAVVFACVVNLP